MHQGAVPTWGRSAAIGRRGKTLRSFTRLARKRCSRGSSALVSVDCLCVAQGCVAGRSGNARATKKYNVTLLNLRNLLEIGSTFSGTVFWGITRTFSRAVEFGVYYRVASDLRSERQTLLESPLSIERDGARAREMFVAVCAHREPFLPFE